MKNIFEYLKEKISLNEANESIKNADDFKSYAENKFKEVFGDELDEEQMNMIIKKLIEEQKENNTDWGEIVGKLNKSFGSK